MPTISDLISRLIEPEPKARHKPKAERLTARLDPRSEKPHDRYEAEVFNFLLENMQALGIANVTKFAALRVDGRIELLDGMRLAVEIKYRMNWEKACQAEYEFRQFLKSDEARKNPVKGGIVFFEEFSGDWGRRAQSRRAAEGWSYWYRNHSKVEDLRFDLLRLSVQHDPTSGSTAWKLEGFPTAVSEQADTLDAT